MLPPGLHSQQAVTILPTLMPIPPALPPRSAADVKPSPQRKILSVFRFAVPEKRNSHV